jgi:RNA polymerase sigma-70 factor (ECF subfamily)
VSRFRAVVVRSIIGDAMHPARQHSSRVVPLRDEPVSDAELVARVRGGDRWAEEVLFRRHFGVVSGTVARLLGDAHEAEDVVQDTFHAAITDLASLREPGAFRGWLVQIAVRKVHRRFRRRRLLRMLGFDTSDPEIGLSQQTSADASPELRAELVLLDRVLATLPASERIAWTLRCVEGLRLEEVAAACGCSLATVKRRVAAAHGVVSAHVAFDRGGAP